jgi:hypothetical protein
MRRIEFRRLVSGCLLLCVAGCGCGPDCEPDEVAIVVQPSSLGFGLSTPICRVEVESDPAPVVPVDVFFLLDDGRDMAGLIAPGRPPPQDDTSGVLLGINPPNPDDERERSFAAQRIFAQLQKKVEGKLKDRIAAEYANDPSPFPDGFDVSAYIEQLDFAFGVGRYEDFGGDFWKAPSATLLNRRARPFILNMPLLRTKVPGFEALFADALAREAPGDGNPIDDSTGVPVRVSDPQSGIEALYQVAAGPNTQFPSGFDGDASGDTLGSGQPCGLAADLNPQTAPGTTGDVPAIRFGGPLPDELDPDGDPNFSTYMVLDENGDPVRGQEEYCLASGNIGGVGWRDGAARFVILAGDIASVSPTRNPQPAEPPESVENTDGAPDAPRGFTFIPMPGFDGNAGRHGLAGPGISPGVSGLPGELGVAPEGAHTVEEAIEALNALDIEVINLAAPDVISNDTKPTVPGDSNVNGDADSDIHDVIKYFPTITPWTWMTGVSRLTGAVSPTKTSTQAPVNLALVYNLATVWPYVSEAEQFDEDNIRPDVVDDLVDRLMEWVKGNHLTVPTGKPSLPTVYYDLELKLDLSELSDLAPEGTGAGPLLLPDRRVPLGYFGEDTPPFTDVCFPLAFNVRDESVRLPVNEDFGFRIEIRFNRIEGDTPANARMLQQVLAELRGRGLPTRPSSDPGPDPTVCAEGTVTLNMWSTLPEDNRATLIEVTRGHARIRDPCLGESPAAPFDDICR